MTVTEHGGRGSPDAQGTPGEPQDLPKPKYAMLLESTYLSPAFSRTTMLRLFAVLRQQCVTSEGTAQKWGKPMGWVKAPVTRLGEQLGLGRNAVGKAISKLVAHGHLVLYRDDNKGGGRCREYLVATAAEPEILEIARQRVLLGTVPRTGKTGEGEGRDEKDGVRRPTCARGHFITGPIDQQVSGPVPCTHGKGSSIMPAPAFIKDATFIKDDTGMVMPVDTRAYLNPLDPPLDPSQTLAPPAGARSVADEVHIFRPPHSRWVQSREAGEWPDGWMIDGTFADDSSLVTKNVVERLDHVRVAGIPDRATRELAITEGLLKRSRSVSDADTRHKLVTAAERVVTVAEALSAAWSTTTRWKWGDNATEEHIDDLREELRGLPSAWRQAARKEAEAAGYLLAQLDAHVDHAARGPCTACRVIDLAELYWEGVYFMLPVCWALCLPNGELVTK